MKLLFVKKYDLAVLIKANVKCNMLKIASCGDFDGDIIEWGKAWVYPKRLAKYSKLMNILYPNPEKY